MEDKNVTLLSAGELKIHQPSQGHCVSIGNVPTTAFFMAFVCKNECVKLFHNKVVKMNSEQKQLLSKLIMELCLTFELNNHQLLLENFVVNPTAPIGAEQMVCSYLEQLLISLLRSNLGERQTHANSILLEQAMENRIVSNIKEYIDAHLSDQLSIEFLSNHFHYSRAYISAKFTDATGQGISEYISMKRIALAKELLENQTMNISQISDKLGYSSVQYFSRRFRQMVGCSPTEYISSIQQV
jgi:YesN/AraC family two-component response regulator